jgi:hypothetical protein
MYRVNKAKTLTHLNKDSRILGVMTIKTFILFVLVSLVMPLYMYLMDFITMHQQWGGCLILTIFSYFIVFKLRVSEVIGQIRKFCGASSKCIKINRQ